jgi:hypothetical protein
MPHKCLFIASELSLVYKRNFTEYAKFDTVIYLTISFPFLPNSLPFEIQQTKATDDLKKRDSSVYDVLTSSRFFFGKNGFMSFCFNFYSKMKANSQFRQKSFFCPRSRNLCSAHQSPTHKQRFLLNDKKNDKTIPLNLRKRQLL